MNVKAFKGIRATYSPALLCSTIGPESIRDGLTTLFGK